MSGIISAVLGPLLKIAASLVGDAIVAKWVAEARLWWRKQVDPTLQRQSDEIYDKLADQWEQLRKDRQNPTNSNSA